MTGSNKPLRKVLLRTLVNTAVSSLIVGGTAYAGGFSLYNEGNGASSGNYGAGLAAEVADASIGWYNPAGLVLISEQQLVVSGVGVLLNASLSGTSTFTAEIPPVPPIVYQQEFSGLQSNNKALVPAAHYALPLGENVTFGLSLVSPFGLATNWNPESPIRYAGTFTELITGLLSPELGARINEHWSIGAGLDLEYAHVTFNQIVGAPGITDYLYFDPMLLDSFSDNNGSSYGVGFHAGLLAMFNDNHTRIGLNYQSQVRHKFYGQSKLTGPLATPSNIFMEDTFADGVFISDALASNAMHLPDIVTLSAYQDVSDTFALLGSVIYTGWSRLKTIELNNVAAALVSGIDDPEIPGSINPSLLNIISPQHYRDTWRVAVGANYYLNQNLMLRLGGGYDQTPTVDAHRDVRLPDSNRWALAAGARYWFKPNVSIDAGYTHLFGIDNHGVHRTDLLGPNAMFNVDASASATANLVGVQVNWRIG